MSSTVALVPGAPLLAKELSGLAHSQIEAAVDQAVGILRRAERDSGAQCIEVWGVDPVRRVIGDFSGSFSRWGVNLRVGGARPAVSEIKIPDAALVAWWFLDQAASTLPRSFAAVDLRDDNVAGAGGSRIAAPLNSENRLMVMVADGPASLAPRAPIPEDPRGVELNERLGSWIKQGGALPDVGEKVASEIGWWSRAGWLALAELVGTAPAVESISWAPFGVGYHAGRWSLPGTEKSGL